MILILQRYMLKYLWVKGQDVSKLLLSSSEKDNVCLTQREKQKSDKMLIIGIIG